VAGEAWDGRRYVTAQQAADYLAVNVRTVYRWSIDGRLRAHRIAGTRAVRFRRVDVERLLEVRDRDDGHPSEEG
jgi:excisionase family DNA binding protein